MQNTATKTVHNSRTVILQAEYRSTLHCIELTKTSIVTDRPMSLKIKNNLSIFSYSIFLSFFFLPG